MRNNATCLGETSPPSGRLLSKRATWGVGSWVALALWANPVAAQAPTPNARDISAVDAARLYHTACATCHGLRGDGNGRGVARLGTPRPRDFTAGVFKFRSTPSYAPPTDEDLYRVILRGVPGTWMPAWNRLLSEAEMWALAAYIRGFSTPSELDPPIEIPDPPEPTPELVREGQAVYAVLQCGQCHGVAGRGDGPSADDLRDDWEYPIDAYDFTRGNYKNGSTPSDLYRTLVTGLSGTPMPALERENLTFPGGPDVDVTPMQQSLDPERAEWVGAFVAAQPTAVELEAMTEGEVVALVQHRTWALVYYVRSLNRPAGAFYWLFRGNPDLQGTGGSQ